METRKHIAAEKKRCGSHNCAQATNRVNTIFMTTLFIGGSLGTFCSGLGWSMLGRDGVCLVGVLFAFAPLLLSAYEKHIC